MFSNNPSEQETPVNEPPPTSVAPPVAKAIGREAETAVREGVAGLETPVNEREAAGVLGLRPATLRRWRCTPPAGGGPPFLKYGTSHTAAVRYLVSELLEWRESQRHRDSRESDAESADC